MKAGYEGLCGDCIIVFSLAPAYDCYSCDYSGGNLTSYFDTYNLPTRGKWDIKLEHSYYYCYSKGFLVLGFVKDTHYLGTMVHSVTFSLSIYYVCIFYNASSHFWINNI